MVTKSAPELEATVWSHIHAERFSDARVVVEQLVSQTSSADPRRLWHLYGLLGSIHNSLRQTDEATSALRRALDEARRIGAPGLDVSRVRPEIGVSRYMLANQYLIFGDPANALAEAMPIPEGVGHVECLLLSIVAQALWKLDRRAEAQTAAESALAAAPTDERLTELRGQLAHVLPDSSGR